MLRFTSGCRCAACWCAFSDVFVSGVFGVCRFDYVVGFGVWWVYVVFSLGVAFLWCFLVCGGRCAFHVCLAALPVRQ